MRTWSTARSAAVGGRPTKALPSRDWSASMAIELSAANAVIHHATTRDAHRRIEVLAPVTIDPPFLQQLSSGWPECTVRTVSPIARAPMAQDPLRIPVTNVIPAGPFSAWFQRARASLASDVGADVPCGDCTACCTASMYVHVRPDETGPRAAIPPHLLTTVPRLPEGHRVMGWDAHGHCPMLKSNSCSIYADRPQTCRDFDCRVFAATGVEPLDKPLIAARARRWRFEHPTARDRTEHAAVRAAAECLREHAAAFTTWKIPTNPIQFAVLALKASGAFLDDPTRAERDPPGAIVRDVMTEVRRYDG
jgi:Fe-S-cluster containining protein